MSIEAIYFFQCTREIVDFELAAEFIIDKLENCTLTVLKNLTDTAHKAKDKVISVSTELKLINNLLLLLKEVGSARLKESDIHPISPKTPDPQCQPIDRKNRQKKIVEDYCWDRAAFDNKKTLALLLKPTSPTP